MSDEAELVEVGILSFFGRERTRPLVTFEPGATVGQVGCIECAGTGWWGYGPTPETCGPCVDCKGTGRVWVGLA